MIWWGERARNVLSPNRPCARRVANLAAPSCLSSRMGWQRIGSLKANRVYLTTPQTQWAGRHECRPPVGI